MPTGRPPAGVLARPLYGPSSPHGPVKGPDVFAVKELASRVLGPDVWPRANFDQHYSRRFETAVKVANKHAGVAQTGQLGTATFEWMRTAPCWDKPGEWAFTPREAAILKAEWPAWHAPHLSPIEQVQLAMVDFGVRSIKAAAWWHYWMGRPMEGLGRKPELEQESDCSTGATEFFFWARLATGILVPDPNGRGFDGFGNTDSLWAANVSRRVLNGSYQVGDLALFWNHGGHVIICIEPGDASSSEWWSNGSEKAPYNVTLGYRGDLRGVVRPRLVP